MKLFKTFDLTRVYKTKLYNKLRQDRQLLNGVILILVILVIFSIFGKKIENILTAISIIFAIYSWINNRKKEIEIIQRNKRLEFLEDSYKKIAMGVQRDPECKDNKKFQEGLEEAIATIQLYGTKELITNLLESMPHFDKVLYELRNSLREEFNLEKIDAPIKPVRSDKELKAIKEYTQK